MRIRVYLRVWKEDDVFFYPLIWLTCGLFVILRGNISHLLGIEWLDIDLIPIFLIYLLSKDQNLMAGCLAFSMGMLTDILAPSQLGLFAFVYSAIILGIDYCRLFFDLNSIKTSILFVAIFLLAKWSFLMIIIGLSHLRQFTPLISFILVSGSVLITSLIAPFLFHLLDLVRGKENGNYP